MKHAWICIVAALTVIGGFLVWWALRREEPRPSFTNEVEALLAKSEAEKLVVELGTEAALKRVEAQHADALAKLDEKKKAEAAFLRENPGELAKFLVRAGRPR